MKRLVFGFLSGFMLLLAGCNNDEGYSLNDTWVGFGVVQDTITYTIKLDGGEILVPVSYSGWTNDDKFGTDQLLTVGERVGLNFTILDDKANEAGEIELYYVKINSARKILTKEIATITQENQDSIGNDPIIVKDCWMANGLLNFQLKYYGQYKTHYINLVKQPRELAAEGQPIQLELRHNNNDDNEDIPYTAYVSFHLDSLQVPGLDSVRFKVTSTDYDGELFEYEGVYKYGGNN